MRYVSGRKIGSLYICGFNRCEYCKYVCLRRRLHKNDKGCLWSPYFFDLFFFYKMSRRRMAYNLVKFTVLYEAIKSFIGTLPRTNVSICGFVLKVIFMFRFIWMRRTWFNISFCKCMFTGKSAKLRMFWTILKMPKNS